MLLNCGVGEDSWESLGLKGDPTSPSLRKSVLNIHWKDWCWSWNCNTLATWCEELTHLKRPSCWERLKAGGEGDNRGCSGWMASPTRWTWVWVSSRGWWWTGMPGVLQFMGSQRVGHHGATERTEYLFLAVIMYFLIVGKSQAWILTSSPIFTKLILWYLLTTSFGCHSTMLIILGSP